MSGLVARARRVARVAVRAQARRNALHEWQRARAGEPPLPAGPLRNVLVVCQGNICRSPFAAALLSARRPDLAVRSAGLAAGEGAPAEAGARRVARSFEIDLDPHAARALASADVEWADLILGMEAQHIATLRKRFPAAAPRSRVLGDFLSGPPYTIADPWGRNDAFFAETFRRIGAAVDRLGDRLGPVHP